jgi:hypothetical protein
MRNEDGMTNAARSAFDGARRRKAMVVSIVFYCGWFLVRPPGNFSPACCKSQIDGCNQLLKAGVAICKLWCSK